MSGVDHYGRAYADACSGYSALKPPNRVKISVGAAQNLVIKQIGGAGGPWDAAEAPYMAAPMDSLASRAHEAVVFVGPARTGKTAGLLLGWMAHNIANDPGDMLFIQMSKEKAREFSKTDVARALRNSPNLQRMRTGRRDDANTHDEMFRHGMWLRIAWPTVGNVSGSTYRYVGITDIDRIENAENLDGEGPLFDLAKKRTQTFLSRGMTLVESSPGYPLNDPNWKPATPHEAPPAGGILNLYNRSDRHRWYWSCPDCCDWFEAAPGLALFRLPSDTDLLEQVRTMNIPAYAEKYARIICPHCGSIHGPERKNTFNAGGRWVPDNATIDAAGVLHGTPMSSTIRGYWLGGVAAAFQSWKSMLENHLYGLRDYALTGSEEKLKQTTNTDQGLPYMPRHLVESKSNTGSTQSRAEIGLSRYVVPPETRCLVGSVDVQGGVNSRFVVQVHAVGPYMEQWLIDRFEIKRSARPGMGEEFAPIDPAGYPEDWDMLTEKLLRSTWRTPDDTREMKIVRLIVDSGGEDGVTLNAYAWFRRLRKSNLALRARLYKGSSVKGAPVVKESLVGQPQGKGDVPLLVCNPNLLSDAVAAGLRRQGSGPGYIHFPAARHPTLNPDGWLPQSFFDELEAETRNASGTWMQIRTRNESFDLCRMIHACMLSLGLDKITDWNAVPAWLAPLDQNSEIVSVDDRREMKANTPIAVTAEVRVVRRQQRPRRSSVAAL